MLELYKIVLMNFQAYGPNIFLPCLLAFIVIALHKKDKLKKIWILLLGLTPVLVICNLFFLTTYNYSYIFTIFIIFAVLYSATIVIANKCGKSVLACCLYAPLIFLCSYLSLATYEYFDLREPLGSVDEHALPSYALSDHDYTVRINYADAWGNDNYTLTIRGKKDSVTQEDSILFCKQYRACAGVTVTFEDSINHKTQTVVPTERNHCQWEALPEEKKSTFFKLKELAENYHQEYKLGFVLDGYTFNIDIIDYEKRTVRSLKLENATNYEHGVPNAKEIVELGFKLIPFNKDSIDVSTECNERLPQLFAQMKADSALKDSARIANDSNAMVNLKEVKSPKPKRRKATKK